MELEFIRGIINRESHNAISFPLNLGDDMELAARVTGQHGDKDPYTQQLEFDQA